MLSSVRLWLFFLVWLPVELSAAPIILDDKNNIIEAQHSFKYFIDKSRDLTISDVSAAGFDNNFTPSPRNLVSFGRDSSAHWVKFELINQSSLTWYLVIDNVILVQHGLYILQSDAPDSDLPQQYFTPVEQRLPTYRLNLEKSGHYTVYLRLCNKGKGALFAPIKLLNADKIQQKIASEALFFGCMVMGIIAMAIYNLLLFFRLKDNNYLTLAVTQFAIVLILQRLNNILPLPINLSNPEEPLFCLAFLFLMITSIILIRGLLGTRKNDPVADKFLRVLLVILVLLLPLFPLIPHTGTFSFITGLIIAISMLVLMIRKYPEGDSVIKVFFIAASIFIVGSLPIVAWGLGLTGAFNLASYSFHISALISSIMMSLALAENTRVMKQQTDQAQAANMAKTEFLTTMSHELRTPMHTVVAIGSLMKLTPLSNQQKNYIEKLHVSSRHIMSIIERVLDLSRLENNSVSLDNKPFRLKDIIERVEKLLGDQARQKNLSFYLHSDYPQTRLLEGDPTRLSQVLLNLLGNAIKFTDKGYVSLLITPLNVEEQHHTTLTFTVIDTGIGLSLKRQQNLFKPFSQVNSPHTSKRGGFGLGLAISEKLVRNMGGYLGLESSPGKGSRFFFTLTFTEPEAAEQPALPSAIPAQSLAGLRILLVDDDEINRFLGLELLQAFGAAVNVADSGKTTLQLLEINDYDLILIDISMPEMDGYETTRRIRDSGLYDLPIIALTAHAISGERDRCLQAGMNDYMTKPFETHDLLTMIRFWATQSLKSNPPNLTPRNLKPNTGTNAL